MSTKAISISDASALGALDSLTFDGQAETNGHFAFIAGASDNELVGGALADTFDLTRGAGESAYGEGGDDIFSLRTMFTTGVTINGGSGYDELDLNGDYSAGVTMAETTLLDIEKIGVAAGHSYNLTTDNATVASGASLTMTAPRWVPATRSPSTDPPRRTVRF